MALDVKVTSFQAPGTNSTNNQTYAHGLASTPQVTLFWTINNATADSILVSAFYGVGASDEASDHAIGIYSQDGIGTSDSEISQEDSYCGYTVNTSDSILHQFNHSAGTSWDSTNIALDFAKSNNAAHIGMLAIAGLTHAEVGSFDTTSSSGNQDVPTTYGSKPDLVIFFAVGKGISDGYSNTDITATQGFANASGENGCWSGWSDDSQSTTNTKRALRTDACLHIFNNTTDILLANIADVGDWPSDGFRIEKTTDSSSVRINYVALWGVDSKITTIDQATSTGDVSYDIGIDTPEGILFLSHQQTSIDGTKENHCYLNVGWATGVGEENAIWISDVNANSTTDSARYFSTNRCYCSGQPATVIASAQLKSFDSDGFDLTWQDVDATARKILVCAFKESVGGGDIDVSATTDALSLTENSVIVSYDINVLATSQNLTLMEQSVKANLDVAVSTSSQSLELTQNDPTISYDLDITATSESLEITQYDPTVDVSSDVNVQASTEELVLTEYDPNVNAEISLTTTSESLELTENSLLISAGTNISASSEALDLTENFASIKIDKEVITSSESLELTENTSTVNAETMITCTSSALTLTELSQTIKLNVNIDVTTEVLTLTEYAISIGGDINVLASIDALILTEYAAVVSTSTTVSGLMIATLTASIPGATITASIPTANITAKVL